MFLSLVNLIESLGLPINQEKVSKPIQQLTCLGIDINAHTGVLSIPPQKISQIKTFCLQWATRKYATRKSLQHLVGHLIYIHKCVSPARLFVNRVLQVLRNAPIRGRILLNEAFYRDISWFNTFLEEYNGCTKIHRVQDPHFSVYVDACLQGLGAYCNDKVYFKEIPECYKWLLNIVHYEMMNVVVAFRTWAHLWKDSSIQVHCDNSAVVSVLNTGISRDPFLATCARTLWLIKACCNIKVKVIHIHGKDNIYADTLSRWFHFKHTTSAVVQYLKSCEWYTVDTHWLQPNFSI